MRLIKWFWIVFIWLISLISILVYISSLYSYKESDFENIPENFFNTFNYNKYINSEENGFKDFKELIAFIDKNNKDIDLDYFDKQVKCQFSLNKKITKGFCNNKILGKGSEKKYEKLLDFHNKINKKILLLNKKEFFLEDYDHENISYFNFIKYSRVLLYISKEKVKSWDIIWWLDILLKHQQFIDNLINKWDFKLILNLVLITESNINLTSIKFWIENYNLNYINKKSIYNILNNKIRSWLISNWLKGEKVFFEKRFLEINNSTSLIDNLLKLFYSEKETLLLNKAITYDIIKNNWEFKIFEFPEYLHPSVTFNISTINNIVWRILLTENRYLYNSSFIEEEKMHLFRKEIQQNLKKILKQQIELELK